MDCVNPWRLRRPTARRTLRKIREWSSDLRRHRAVERGLCVAQRIARFDGSKALLSFSDGNDTGSTHKPEAAPEAAQRAKASIYAIQYPDGLTGFTESEPMRHIAELTGGLLLRAPGLNVRARRQYVEP